MRATVWIGATALTGAALLVALARCSGESSALAARDAAALQQSEAVAPNTNARRGVAWAPGPVQILRRPVTAVTDGSGDTVLAEVEHLGPLTGRDRDALDAAIRQRLTNREQRIAANPPAAQDSAGLLQEAGLLLDAAAAKAALRALDTGSYVTTRPGEKTPPLTLPEAEVLRTGAMHDGSPVNVTIVMPWRDHSELAQARSYYDAMLDFDTSERARRFNALPDDERLRLARQIAAILRKPHATQDELGFVRNWIGFGSQVDETQGLVIAPRH